jgi:predicted dehydrogenase
LSLKSTPARKVIWGVVGTSRIGTAKVIPALQSSRWCEVRAIASRTEARARAVAKALNIPKAYGSYEALLADPEIEAIYNPLPNHLHVSLTMQAAERGKHVLCEKPMALNAAEAERLRVPNEHVLIMEAFMVRFHLQWLRARELVRSGELGVVRTVHAMFSYFDDDPSDVRNQATIGGGALYDIGCYPIVAGRFLFEAEPERVIAMFDRDPAFHTDRTVSALVDFGQSRRLAFTASTQSVPYQRMHIIGTKQRLELLVPFSPRPDAAAPLFLDDGALAGDAGARHESVPPCDQYLQQVEAFARAIRGDVALPYGVDDAVKNMRVIDALFRSEASGRWEHP